MICVDTSVVFAHLLAEDGEVPPTIWSQILVSSRLLEYEVWSRIHARGLGKSHGDAARELLHRLAFLELAPPVLTRALEPFPVQVRTLDALHLASVLFLLSQNQPVELATYDERMLVAARRMRIPELPLF